MKSSGKRDSERRHRSRSPIVRRKWRRKYTLSRRKVRCSNRRKRYGHKSSSSTQRRRKVLWFKAKHRAFRFASRAARCRFRAKVKRSKRRSLFGLARCSVARKRSPPRPAKRQACGGGSSSSSSSRKVVRRANDKVRQYDNQVVLTNCLTYVKSLPSDLLHCTITSPPLRSNLTTDQKSEAWAAYEKSQVALLDELYRVTKPGGHLFYAHKVQHCGNKIFHPSSWITQSSWIVRQEIVWDKGNKPGRSLQRFWPKDERIYWLRKEPGPTFSLHWSTFRWGNVWMYGDSHPGREFPIYLALAILHALKLRRNSLVFDPYGRSGTTAKACQAMKLRYLTTEADQKKVDAIRDRLKTTSKEDMYWTSMVAKQMARRTLDLRFAPKPFQPT